MILHILNGDATLDIFRRSGLKGDVVVWREMLCEGKAPKAKDLNGFFEERATHLQQEYGIDRNNYLTTIGEDYKMLYNAADYEEIVLWFEFDLFCQINMLFVLYSLQQLNVKLPPVSIVQLDEHPDVPNFRGIGMLKPHHMAPLFEERVYFNDEDWQLAKAAWEAYRSEDPLALEEISYRFTDNLPYLGTALQAHLKRLPNSGNGLNAVEHFLLDRLALGKLSEQDLYAQFWDELKIYGFGDFQLDIYTQRLQNAGAVTRNNEMFYLTGLGEEILNSEENYLSFSNNDNLWIGGIPLDHTPWRWNDEEGKVVRY